MSSTPPFRDYLPEGAPPPEPSAPRPAPRPGHGRVWINGAGEKTWWASWQDGEGIRDSPMGSQEQAIAAARAMPAAERVIFSRPDNDYIDLEEWLAARSG